MLLHLPFWLVRFGLSLFLSGGERLSSAYRIFARDCIARGGRAESGLRHCSLVAVPAGAVGLSFLLPLREKVAAERPDEGSTADAESGVAARLNRRDRRGTRRLLSGG